MKFSENHQFTWTQPYCGVQHLNESVPGVRQISVDNYGTFADVWALGLQGFTPFWKQNFNTVEEARKAGEQKARELSY